MYNSYFEFSESPFNVTPDPRFFYTNPVYEEAFAALRYGIEAKKGFIVIIGEVGTGKTTLLRKLMRNPGQTIDSVFIFNTLVSFPELLRLIIHDLGVTPRDSSKVTMLQELNDYLIKRLQEGHIVSVLIDEAQNLSDETLEGLRLLSNLETDQEKLLQIVLMGQPELKAKLDQANLRQLKQRVALQCQLAPLKDEEVGPYIEFRLRTIGYVGKDLFLPDAVQQVAFYSQGIPRLINVICDNALLSAFAESTKTVSARMIHEVGRELRLGPKVQVTEAATPPRLLAAQSKQETLIREGSDRAPSDKMRWLIRAGVGSLILILVFFALASVTDPQNFLRIAAKRLEISKRNLNQWFAFVSRQQAASEKVIPVTDQQAVPEKVIAKVEKETEKDKEKEVETKSKHQRVFIQNGSTVSKIISDAYGANSLLALDIIREINPQIKNLNWVFPGQELLLPLLTPESMLRKQPDGSYRLIVASFFSLAEAGKYTRLFDNARYQFVITPKTISDDLILHRVEIAGLKTLEEANQIRDTGLTNQWLAFLGDPTKRDR